MFAFSLIVIPRLLRFNALRNILSCLQQQRRCRQVINWKHEPLALLSVVTDALTHNNSLYTISSRKDLLEKFIWKKTCTLWHIIYICILSTDTVTYTALYYDVIVKRFSHVSYVHIYLTETGLWLRVAFIWSLIYRANNGAIFDIDCSAQWWPLVMIAW